MATTPRQETIIVPAAGVQRVVQISGRWLTILSNTLATVDVAFDSDAFTPMYSRIPYPATGGSYERVRFREPSGAGCTVIAVFASDQIPLGLADAIGAAAMTQIAEVNVAATGGAGTLVVAANPARRKIELIARDTNGGIIYLGDAAANVSAADHFSILYPGGNWWDTDYKGGVWAVGDDALEWVGGYEL